MGAPLRKGNLDHDWVVSALVHVDGKTAKHAHLRHSYLTPAEKRTRIDALEVYCHACRRPFEEAADQPCAAGVDNSHLIGGDLTTRAKRKPLVVPHGAERLPGLPVDRRGRDTPHRLS